VAALAGLFLGGLLAVFTHSVLLLSRPRFTGHLCGERDDHATST
jgi:hypothetical protein